MALLAGSPAPLFHAPSPVNPKFAFGSLGGRYLLLVFLPPAGPERDAAVALVLEHRERLGYERMVFAVVPDEAGFDKLRQEPALGWFGDWSGDIRRLYRAEGPDGALEPQWVMIDPSLRVMMTAPLSEGARIVGRFARLGRPEEHAGVPLHAPVLIVPRILEIGLCRRLIELYEADGGAPSGVMRQVDGKTVGVLDDMKKRRDAQIADEGLRTEIRARLAQRLLPEIEKAFQFTVTRVERYIVARYDAEEGGYFRPHRDNTTLGTAHRKFAVSINLNDDFEGGDLRFPEFGPRTYRPPPGGAVVFSCSLLHEATPVTRGTRYATLPFLYDEAGEAVRRANAHSVEFPEAAVAEAAGPTPAGEDLQSLGRSPSSAPVAS